MNPIELSLKHMAWSNQKFLSFFLTVPDEVFALKASDGDWSVGRILTHFAHSGEWFRYCLGGPRWTDLRTIKSTADVERYLSIVAELDEFLVSQANLPDETFSVQGEDGLFEATRSLVLAQAVTHTAEHKGQIATILNQHGRHIALDDYTVWSYVNEHKE